MRCPLGARWALLQLLLSSASAPVAATAAVPVGACERALDENTLLQVRLDVEEADSAALPELLDQYVVELTALSSHLRSAVGVFRAQQEHLALVGNNTGVGKIAHLLEEVRKVRGRLEGTLGAAEKHQTRTAATRSDSLGLTRTDSTGNPWPEIGSEGSEPTKPPNAKNDASGSNGDPNDLTDPWPTVGGSSETMPDPWADATTSSSSSSTSSSSSVKKKGSSSWLVLMLVALCVIVIAALVVIVSPMSVPEDGGKKQEAKGERTDSKVRSRFAQVALPFWTPTAPSSCGLSFSIFLLGAIFTCASLCFWFCLVAIAIGRSAMPFLVQPDAGTIGHGWLGSMALRIVTILGIFCSPVLWFARWKDIKGRVPQWVLLGTVIFLILIKNAWAVASSFVSRIFMDAMFFSDAEIFWKCYWVQCGGLVFSAIVLMARSYLQSMLGLRWREYLTSSFLDLYMARRSYYELDNYRSGSERIDNPDQRIQEDANVVTIKLLAFFMDLLDSFVGLISFATVLWNMKPIMTVVAIGYSILGSIFGLFIAWRLVVINYIVQRNEADFRFSLVHIRNNPEAIAFYGGEAREKKITTNRFDHVMEAIFWRIKWDAATQGYMSFYTALATILPPMLLFRSYFHGDLDFGAITQAGQAFATTMTSLSFVVGNMHMISDLATAGNRLSSLMVLLRRPDEPSDVTVVNTSEAELRISDLTASVPGAAGCFVRGLSLASAGGGPTRVLLVGPSGVGKSSLLRVVAGLWRTGRGEVVRPPNQDCLFLPQKPYMPLGDLRTQLTYPDELEAGPQEVEVEAQRLPRAVPVQKQVSDADLRAHLASVGLGGLPDRFEDGFRGVCDWPRILSVGEQQRLASVRIFIRQPKLTILDEATSALSPPDEAKLYQRLVDANLSYLSVGHRDTLIKYHDRVIELQGGGDWKLYTGKEYAEVQAKKKV